MVFGLGYTSFLCAGKVYALQSTTTTTSVVLTGMKGEKYQRQGQIGRQTEEEGEVAEVGKVDLSFNG